MLPGHGIFLKLPQFPCVGFVPLASSSSFLFFRESEQAQMGSQVAYCPNGFGRTTSPIHKMGGLSTVAIFFCIVNSVLYAAGHVPLTGGPSWGPVSGCEVWF